MTRKRILVVDDRDDHRIWMAAFLRAEGHAVVEAHSGQELLDVLQGVPSGYFSVVICDQMMPGLRGTECLARASSRSKWLIVSAATDPLIAQAASRFGAVAFIQKPIDPVELLRLVSDGPPPSPSRRSRPSR